jgi:hypothetical protein
MNKMSRHASALAALTAAAIFSLVMPAFSQAPTDAQRSAIRSACRSDYMAHCSSVSPGGMEALQCLQKNMSGLSSTCQSAVRAVEPKAEAKPEEKPGAKTEAKPEAKPEAKHEAPAAATAEPAAKPAAEPKSAAAPAPAPAAKKPTSAQTAAIRSACRSDYMANCSSVPPGGAASLKCLKQHEAKLSAKCQQAVSAVGTAAPAAGAPVDTAAAPGAAPGAAPAVAPMVLRPMLPREVLFVLRSGCGVDARALCAGVPPGGGRIVQCLASQPASLSPECTGALSPFAR